MGVGGRQRDLDSKRLWYSVCQSMWNRYLLAGALLTGVTARGGPSRPVRWPEAAERRQTDEEEAAPVWGGGRSGRQFGLFGLSNPFGILGT